MNSAFVERSEMVQSLRRALYEVKVRWEINRAQNEINRAFAPSRFATLQNPVATFAFVAVGLLTLTLTGYAITTPGSATISPTKVPLVSPPLLNLPKPGEEERVLALTPPMPEENLSHLPDLFDLPTIDAELPTVSTESPYTLLVDKKNKKLYVLEESKDNFIIVDSFPIATGSKDGDKFVSGDLHTPEGVYHITTFKSDAELPDSYGPGAFVLNYPNDLDRRNGKTGYGIWIHGSGLGEGRAPTEGCLEMNDFHIVDLEKYAAPGTPVVIYPSDYGLPISNNVVQKNLLLAETVYGVKEWFATAQLN